MSSGCRSGSILACGAYSLAGSAYRNAPRRCLQCRVSRSPNSSRTSAFCVTSGRGRVLPTWRGGGGFLYADREVPEFGTRYNFSLLLEFGVDVLLGEGTALLVEYRFRHVSNADLAGSNPGVNAHGLAIGLTLFLGETRPGRDR